MPKKVSTPVVVIDATDSKQINRVSDDANALAELRHEDEKDARQLAKKLGYSGSLEPTVLAQLVRLKYSVAEASFYEYSGYLALLRENTKRGNWNEQLIELGITERMAQMHISMFKRASATTAPEAIMRLGYTKNKVLQTLDDEEFKELAQGASINGIALSNLQKMSTAELRKKLAEAELQKVADQKVFADQSAELIQLKRGKARVADNDWQANFAPLRDQIHVATRELDNQIGVVDLVMDQALSSPYDGPDADSADEVLQRARGEVADQVRDLIARQRRVFCALERKFEQTLGMFATDADAASQGHAE